MLMLGTNYYLMRLYSKLPRDIKGHSMRVSVLMQIITNGYIDLGSDKAGGFTEENREKLTQFAREAGSYHDIGKISVPRQLLTMKRKPTQAEYDEIKRHTLYAQELLGPCIGQMSTEEQRYYGEIKKVCVSHHEHWDGKGYPHGLSGKDIPVFSRICAVADTYDAMTSLRSYSDRASHSQAVSEIRRCSSTQFDPALVEAFLSNAEEINRLLAGKKQ